MLVDDDGIINCNDPIIRLISTMNGGAEELKLATGVYQIGHFGSSHWPDGDVYKRWWEHWDEVEISPYGVCDGWEQIIEKWPMIRDDQSKRFIITLTPIIKEQQSPDGGWRWHKWGPYIGKHQQTQEYLYDEPHIDRVYVYHIYERI